MNSTAVLMATPLLVAVFAATAELRRALRADDRAGVIRWAVAGGLVIAAVTSARTPLGVVAALTIAIGAAAVLGTPVRARLRSIAVAAGATVVAIAPWSIAEWQSVRTPFYPLVPGNINPDGPVVKHVPIDGFNDLAHQAFHLIRSGPFLWLALALLVATILVRRVLPDATLVGIAAAVVAVVLVGFAFRESWESQLRVRALRRADG